MWGTDINNIHAVGGEGTYRFHDGKEFQRKDELTSEEVSLYGVWGSASDDVYIVGSHGTILHLMGMMKVSGYHGIRNRRISTKYMGFIA